MENIAAVLRAEGLNFGNIIKTTISLTNLADFQTVNELYGSYFIRSAGSLNRSGRGAAQGRKRRN